MTIKLELAGQIARITGEGGWTSRSAALTEVLDAQEALLRTRAFYSSDPDPELTSATHMVRVFGGRIIERKGREPEKPVAGRIY